MMNNAKKLTLKKKREHKNTHRKINDFDYTKLVTLKVQINKKVFLLSSFLLFMWCDVTTVDCQLLFVLMQLISLQLLIALLNIKIYDKILELNFTGKNLLLHKYGMIIVTVFSRLFYSKIFINSLGNWREKNWATQIVWSLLANTPLFFISDPKKVSLSFVKKKFKKNKFKYV